MREHASPRDERRAAAHAVPGRRGGQSVSKPVSERELLLSQIQRYEFYAGLIDRAVGGATSAKLPRWDVQRAEDYMRMAEELRAQLAALDEREANAPATTPGLTK